MKKGKIGDEKPSVTESSLTSRPGRIFKSSPSERNKDVQQDLHRPFYKTGYSFVFLAAHFSDSRQDLLFIVNECLKLWKKNGREEIPPEEATVISAAIKSPKFNTVTELSTWVDGQLKEWRARQELNLRPSA